MGDAAVYALKGVSLSIRTGEHVAIVGPSGSGKSTLLHIFGCLDRPTSGSYRLAGQEVAQLDEQALSRLRRYNIGFIFQFFHLLARLTAIGNVEVPMIFAAVPADERRERAERALRAVGLGHRLEHRPDQLSGGERQRVAIARAVVMGPQLLLADEPTGNLDRASAAEVMALLASMTGDSRTLVVVTHDLAIAERAGRILKMEDGALFSSQAGGSMRTSDTELPSSPREPHARP
jgi:ABC-type lipoprotein export system ATPase subunit